MIKRAFIGLLLTTGFNLASHPAHDTQTAEMAVTTDHSKQTNPGGETHNQPTTPGGSSAQAAGLTVTQTQQINLSGQSDYLIPEQTSSTNKPILHRVSGWELAMAF